MKNKRGRKKKILKDEPKEEEEDATFFVPRKSEDEFDTEKQSDANIAKESDNQFDKEGESKFGGNQGVNSDSRIESNFDEENFGKDTEVFCKNIPISKAAEVNPGTGNETGLKIASISGGDSPLKIASVSGSKEIVNLDAESSDSNSSASKSSSSQQKKPVLKLASFAGWY